MDYVWTIYSTSYLLWTIIQRLVDDGLTYQTISYPKVIIPSGTKRTIHNANVD